MLTSLRRILAGRRARIAALLVALIALAGLALMLHLRALEARGRYAPLRPEVYERFAGEYALAREAEAPWIRDPRQVALHVSGGAPCRREQVRTFPAVRGRAVFIVEHLPGVDCGSDSIHSVKYRIDLVRRGEAWEVEWAGTMWRCWGDRGGSTIDFWRGYTGWRTEPCP